MSISSKLLKEFLDVSMEKSQNIDLGKYHYTIRCTFCESACAISFFEQTKFSFAALGKLGAPLYSHCKKLEKAKEIEDLRKLSGVRPLFLIANNDDQEGE